MAAYCQNFACEIQKCLNDKNFQSEKCLPEIDDFYKCCISHPNSSICPKKDRRLIELKERVEQKGEN